MVHILRYMSFISDHIRQKVHQALFLKKLQPLLSPKDTLRSFKLSFSSKFMFQKKMHLIVAKIRFNSYPPLLAKGRCGSNFTSYVGTLFNRTRAFQGKKFGGYLERHFSKPRACQQHFISKKELDKNCFMHFAISNSTLRLLCDRKLGCVFASKSFPISSLNIDTLLRNG